MATMYRMTDAGAPGLEPNASYNNAKVFMQIVKACLVDGYGDKDGAGWTLVYEDTTVGKHRMAISNGNGVIEFVTWSSTGVAMFVWEELTTPGTGRLGDDPWETVVSTGVNGMSSNNNPLPGTSANQVAGLYVRYLESASSLTGWTIFADSRSFWFAGRYPVGHSNTVPGSRFAVSGQYHIMLFAGAVKSADFAPDTKKNFFVIHGGTAAGTSTPSASVNTMGYNPSVFGLMTPTNLSPGANLALRAFTAPSQFTANPYSSVRAILPYVLTYDGPDKPVPSGINASSDEYAFATIPGIGKFSESGGNGHNFWAYYTALHADAWFHELQEFGGIQWMPYGLASDGNDGLTTDDAWWT